MTEVTVTQPGIGRMRQCCGFCARHMTKSGPSAEMRLHALLDRIPTGTPRNWRGGGNGVGP